MSVTQGLGEDQNGRKEARKEIPRETSCETSLEGHCRLVVREGVGPNMKVRADHARLTTVLSREMQRGELFCLHF